MCRPAGTPRARAVELRSSRAAGPGSAVALRVVGGVPVVGLVEEVIRGVMDTGLGADRRGAAPLSGARPPVVLNRWMEVTFAILPLPVWEMAFKRSHCIAPGSTVTPALRAATTKLPSS